MCSSETHCLPAKSELHYNFYNVVSLAHWIQMAKYFTIYLCIDIENIESGFVLSYKKCIDCQHMDSG